jgi:hypothetical protein
MRIQAKRLLLLAVLVLSLAVPTVVLAAAGYSLFGDATLVTPGFASLTAVQIQSDVNIPPGYGGVDFDTPAGLTVAGLSNLATDYNFIAGSCGGGSPRFQVNVTTPSGAKNIMVYIGPPPSYTGCSFNVWTTTGNLAAPTNLVDATQLGGTFYEPYADVQAAYGSYPVTGIQVVVDSFWFAGTQTVLVDNVQINGTTYTFEGVDICKKDGWQQFTSAPGPFKNQGDCVSFFAHNK